ncbi:MAG: Na/Pi cotransporter family protein [Clostridia bacterium]|nr:Na/Pi cotransporter family protein [Clostridia bacterium]
MSVFDILTLLGGLAMFLYGMRLMSGSLKESSSGTLKKVMEKFTKNPFAAFLLGVLVTALIQSSTATIVITSGLVAAGIIKARNSIGIIMGANVGTTVTGQIIRLIDLNGSSTSWLQIFKPSTLAPVALVAGIILIMFLKFRNSKTIGSIAMGFGILFTGLLNMTAAVNSLNETGVFEKVFTGLGSNPVLGYAAGAGVAFTLQSSSATVGILQALSTSGQLTFKAIYSVLVGVYLGDCVTTAIVCSIGAKVEARRVGIMNILFNLCKTFLVFLGVFIAHSAGWLDAIWNAPIYSGGIANTNTVFNLGCAILLFPMQGVFVLLAEKIVKDKPHEISKYQGKLDALNPVFYTTPALAFRSCYDILLAMFDAAKDNIQKAFGLLDKFDGKVMDSIRAEEDEVDIMADRVSNYLVMFSSHLKSDEHIKILDQYYKVVSEFERLSDHSLNIAETAENLYRTGIGFSEEGKKELKVLTALITDILDCTRQTFAKRDVEAARSIEPLEEVVDDLVGALRDNHLARMREGRCNVLVDSDFANLMSDLERISDVCSNVGVATVARVDYDRASQAHAYISTLHQGGDEEFNKAYTAAHEKYFGMLDKNLAAEE